MTRNAWWVAPTGIVVCMVGCHSLLGLDELEMVDVVGGQGGTTSSSSEGGTATGTPSTGGEAGVGDTGGAGGNTGGQGGNAGGQGGSTGGQGGSEGGAGPICEEGGGGSSGAPYSHTITINGTNDFEPSDEQFVTSSTTPDYTAYFSWDATYFYYGMKGPDVQSNDASYWLLAYFGGVGGTRTGVQYGTAHPQQPVLPFEARYHVAWQADNSDTHAMSAAGTWGPAGWNFTDGVYQSNDFVELRIPLAELGDPPIVRVHLSMINETTGWSYAATPADSFADVDDPDYTRYFAFELSSSRAPANYTSLGGPPRVWINELHYDNTGADQGEGVEVAGPAGIVLDGWHLLAYDGTDGSVYATRALCGVLPNEQAGKGTLWFSFAGDTLQNGAPDGVALVDAAGQLVQWLSYESGGSNEITATEGAAFGLRSTELGVSEDGTTTAPGYSLQLTGQGSSYASFTWTGPVVGSPGAKNAGQTFQ